MNTEISKSKFKAHALEILRQVEKTGEPVIVTDHGTPSLIIRKYEAHISNVRDMLKGSILRYDSPFEPVGVEDWEGLA